MTDEGPCACGSYACVGGDLCPDEREEMLSADPRPMEDGHESCAGCGQEIDPDCCHCGVDRAHHSGWDGHTFIPMGCDCFRSEALSADPRPSESCAFCGALRMDALTDCGCDDDEGIAPTWSEDDRAYRHAVGRVR